MGGKKSNFRGGEDKAREAGQQDREGIELLNMEAGSRISIVVKSKNCWKNREELFLVSRESLNKIWKIPVARANNAKMLFLL